MTGTIRVFRYLEDLDAFVVTDAYREIADSLGLTEWHPAVWIGRLFCMDNDFGEHWFDNWELREQLGVGEDHLVIDPDRFQDGRDGPCHTREFRKRFWTEVLRSFELSLDLLFEKARDVDREKREWLNAHPEASSEGFESIPDLEERIKAIRKRFGARAALADPNDPKPKTETP